MMDECLVSNEEIDIVRGTRIAMCPDGKTPSESVGYTRFAERARGDLDGCEDFGSHDASESFEIRNVACC